MIGTGQVSEQALRAAIPVVVQRESCCPGPDPCRITCCLHIENIVFDDEFKKAPKVIMHPFESSLLDGILRDSSYKFLDNIETPAKETLADDVTTAFKAAVVQLKTTESEGLLPWGRYKGTGVYHLTKLEPFSRLNLPIGGGEHCINATKQIHGPSWRMIVSLTAATEAYGVYPGGQSGNPGSKYYDNMVDSWVSGT